MISNYLNGLGYVKSGFSLIRVEGIRRFVVIPIAINIIVFVGLGWLLSDQFSQLLGSVDWLTNPNTETWLGWLVDKLLVLFWIIFGLAFLIIFTYTFTVVANLIAAPFNSLLSERIEAHLNGKLDHQENTSISHLFKSIPHILRSEVGKISYLIIWMIPVLLLYVIPGVNLIAPFVSFFFGAWMLSLEYIDYPMGNNGLLFGQIKKVARSRRNLSLGFGSAVTLLTAIPLINLIAMPVAVAGATKMWVDELSKQTTSV